jgi:N-acetylmuramoyl-L-alanine amidase
MLAAALTAASSLVLALALFAVGTSRFLRPQPGGDRIAAIATLRPTVPLPPTFAPRPATPMPAAAVAAAPTVCLNPGHGGDDLGAVRERSGEPAVHEAALNLTYARDLAARLEERGVRVVLTRRRDARANATNADVNGDGEVSTQAGSTQLDDLQARIDACNAAEADLLVSMHVNSSDNAAEEGYEVWYTADRPFGEQSRRLATLIADELGARLAAAGHPATFRGVIDDGTSTTVPEGLGHMVMTGPAVPGKVAPSEMPGVIAEPLFLSNDGDAAFLTSDDGQAAIVSAYEAAIVAYLEDHPG